MHTVQAVLVEVIARSLKHIATIDYPGATFANRQVVEGSWVLLIIHNLQWILIPGASQTRKSIGIVNIIAHASGDIIADVATDHMQALTIVIGELRQGLATALTEKVGFFL